MPTLGWLLFATDEQCALEGGWPTASGTGSLRGKRHIVVQAGRLYRHREAPANHTTL